MFRSAWVGLCSGGTLVQTSDFSLFRGITLILRLYYTPDYHRKGVSFATFVYKCITIGRFTVSYRTRMCSNPPHPLRVQQFSFQVLAGQTSSGSFV